MRYSEIASLDELSAALEKLNITIARQERVVRERMRTFLMPIKGFVPIVSSTLGAMVGSGIVQSVVKGMKLGRDIVGIFRRLGFGK